MQHFSLSFPRQSLEHYRFKRAGHQGRQTERPIVTDDQVNALLSVPVMLLGLAIWLLLIVGMWKAFTKANQPGWASIIPIYNYVVAFRIGGLNPWLVLLFVIPVANVIMTVIMALAVGKSYGKSALWSVICLWLLGPIGWLILGFGGARYRGPAGL